MSATQRSNPTWPKWVGVAAAVLGMLGLAGFVWTWVISVGPLDPPDWLRIAGVWMMPVGIVGALFAGFAGLRSAGRLWAIVGLVAAAVALAAFGLLISLWQY